MVRVRSRAGAPRVANEIFRGGIMDRDTSTQAIRELGLQPFDVPEPVFGGWDTEMWRFHTSDGGAHVLRVYPSLERGAGLCQEQAALRAAAAAGLPVPRAAASGVVNGQPMLVLSWLEGEPLLSHLQRRPWRVRGLGRELGRMQARLHMVPPPAEMLPGTPGSWLAWTGVSAVAEQTRGLATNAATGSLIHLDFHPLNVLTDGRRITGILDWGSSAAGDPRADVARTAALLRAGPLPPGPFKPILGLFRNALYDAWRGGYEDATSAKVEASPFMAWGAATWLADMERNVGNAQGWANDEGVRSARQWLGRWATRE
ncbi:MAG: hypothetical protein C0506_15430 [Anaerolinea sp.]|nr:hypothetical protein [Anaerolinea sp.]